MRTYREYRKVRQFAVSAAVAIVVLLAGDGVAAAQPSSVQREMIPPGAEGAPLADPFVSRDSLLEDRVASALRAEGFNQSSRILIMAADNRVYLIGVVPNETIRDQAILSAKEVPGVWSVADHLVVQAETQNKSDLRLQRDIEQRLRPLEERTGHDIRVRTYRGDALLDGSVSGWDEMAQCLQAAFAGGARYVVSDLTVGVPQL